LNAAGEWTCKKPENPATFDAYLVATMTPVSKRKTDARTNAPPETG
jgi:hypothetical protein